ncbi:efflux RND transporter permease subunit [Leptospira sp. 96542]|nr:efflux RND transporter permease subunit [Leptospira sp. 96542]
MKPNLTLMIMLIFALLGILAFNQVNYSPNRESEYNGVLVKVDATGADAFKVEDLVTFPIEKSLSNLGEIEEIRSVSEVGKASIYLKFKGNIDFKVKAVEIREKLDLVAASFPREFHKPQILKYDPTQKPVFIASFESDSLSLNDLRLYLENHVKPGLLSIEGINLVEIAGGELEEIQVACDPLQLEAYKISLLEIINRIQDFNKSISLGPVRSGEKDSFKNLSLVAKYKDIFELQVTPLLVKENGKAILLKDVCKISKKGRDDNLASRINGQEKVAIFVYGTNESSIVLLSQQIRRILDHSIRTDVSYKVHSDVSLNLFSRLRSFGIILVFLSIFFSVRIKSKFVKINIVSFLLSSIFTFFLIIFFVTFFKQRVTELSLLAFLIGQIIVYLLLGHCEKWKEKIGLRFLISLTVVIFLFLFVYTFVDQTIMKEFAEFYLVFVISVLAFNLFYKNLHRLGGKNTLWKKIKINDRFNLKRFYEKIDIGSAKKMKEAKKKYLSNPFLFPATILFLSVLGIYYFVTLDFSNKFENEGGEVSAALEFPAGSSFEYSNRITKDAENKFKQYPDVSEVISKVESERSYIVLKFNENIKIDKALLTSLKKKVGNLDEAYLHFLIDLESPILNEYAFDLLGPSLETLESTVFTLAKDLKEYDGIEDVVLRFKPSREELELIYRGDKFSHSGVTVTDFGEQLRTAIQGGVASKMFFENKEYDIRVRFDESYRKNVKDLSFYKVKNYFKDFVPIEQIIEVRTQKIPSKIYHKDKVRVLSFAVQSELSASKVNHYVNEIFESTVKDISYRIVDYQKKRKSIGSEMISKIMFLILVFAISVFNVKKTNRGDFTTYREIMFFFPYLFLVTYFHQSDFGLYLQIGFVIAFCLEKTSEQKILAMGVLKELFLIAIIVNLLVPPTFYSLALVLNSMLIFLLGRRFFLQVSELWMRENSVRKWKDLLKKIFLAVQTKRSFGKP